MSDPNIRIHPNNPNRAELEKFGSFVYNSDHSDRLNNILISLQQ